ncbi:MAG: hypothetical protein L0387_38410 [Acidobacteria bacterium]|nr:hypothetical protein [Acidobacteriota bacterium]MCI0723027.1 hypothetical protein [Acidobacteriota bacterium]
MFITSNNTFAFIRVHSRLFIPWLFLLTCQTEAAAPVLKALEPRGAQRGQALRVTLVGESLQPSAEISTSLPGAFSRLAPSAEKADTELPLLLQLKENAVPGLYPVRVRTENGLSNVLLFAVGSLPETVEAESLLKEKDRFEKLMNDTPASAEKVALPITVNGTLVGPDQDYYRFNAKAGERLVFEVDARRAGSAIDPVVRVLNAAGKEMAVNNDAPGAGVDARAEVTFAHAGEYLVLVHDAKYSEQDQNFYRLKIGSFPYAEFMFPLGGQRGKAVDVSLAGGSLAAPVVVKLGPAPEKQASHLPVTLPGSASLPFLFRLGDLPELLEPEPALPDAGLQSARGRKTSSAKKTPELAKLVDLPASTVMNGRISRPGEVDKFRVPVNPGQQWVFEVEAASLGASKLLGVLAVYDAATNKRLALTELGQEAGTNPFSFESSRNEVDPRLSVSIPNHVSQVVVSLEDLLGRGGAGFSYRLTAFPQPPDFNVELVTPYVNLPENGTAAIEVLVSRRGYDGPIRLSIPELPEDLVQEGGNIPAEMNPPQDRRPFSLGYLTVTAKPGAKHRPFHLSVWTEATESNPRIRKQAIAPGMVQPIRGVRQKSFKAPWLDASLPVAVANPVPLRIDLPQRHVRIVQGGDYSLPWKLVKGAQASGAIKVENPRPTASIKDLRVLRRPEGMVYGEEGTFHILTTFATPPATFDLVMDASRITGTKSERLITAPAVTVEIVPGYRLKLMSEKLELRQGSRVEVTGKVEREPGFNAVVTVQVEDLPQHVTSQELVIPADQTSFRLVLEAGPESQAGTFDVRLSSSATLPDRRDKQEFKIPDVKARVDVLAGAAALK